MDETAAPIDATRIAVAHPALVVRDNRVKYENRPQEDEK